MNNFKAKLFLYRHVSSSDGLYQDIIEDFILQQVFINRNKNGVNLKKKNVNFRTVMNIHRTNSKVNVNYGGY